MIDKTIFPRNFKGIRRLLFSFLLSLEPRFSYPFIWTYFLIHRFGTLSELGYVNPENVSQKSFANGRPFLSTTDT